MIKFIARRIATGIVLALLVALITFWLLSFSFREVAGETLGPSATPQAITAKMAALGMDRPVLVQFWDWLVALAHGDLGTSYFTSQPVTEIIPSRLAVTLSIIVPATVITAIISVALGVWAASRGGAVDRIAQGISLLGYLVPSLLVALALVAIFAVQLKWLPAIGFEPFARNPLGWLRSITIPVITLCFGGIANLASQVRGSMIGELRKDYIRTLRTSGVPYRSLVLKHALRNAATPSLVVLSLTFMSMFSGALITEKVFALQGFGTLASPPLSRETSRW